MEPLLIIEVADTSLRFDREAKARLHVEAGIADYRIVNLADHVLEVYREPSSGAHLAEPVSKPGAFIRPLSFPALEIAVSDLLP